MTHMDAGPWIKLRRSTRGVVQEGDKWKAELRGDAVGVFSSEAEAFKAYRKAAQLKFGDAAALPTDEEIDKELRGK